MALRSVVQNSCKKNEKLKNNVLPSNADVIGHCNYFKKALTDTDIKFFKQNPGFREVKNKLGSGIASL